MNALLAAITDRALGQLDGHSAALVERSRALVELHTVPHHNGHAIEAHAFGRLIGRASPDAYGRYSVDFPGHHYACKVMGGNAAQLALRCHAFGYLQPTPKWAAPVVTETTPEPVEPELAAEAKACRASAARLRAKAENAGAVSAGRMRAAAERLERDAAEIESEPTGRVLCRATLRNSDGMTHVRRFASPAEARHVAHVEGLELVGVEAEPEYRLVEAGNPWHAEDPLGLAGVR